MFMLDSGHIALAKALIDETYYLAWGTIPDGDEIWSSNPPTMDSDLKELYQEVGRKLSSSKAYVVEDDDGEIEANQKFWSISQTPTNNIYLKFAFNTADASDQTIYQLAVFIGTIPNMDLPEVSASVVAADGTLPVGTTQVSFNNYTTGTESDLFPVENVSEDGGRKITISGQEFRITGFDSTTGLFTITPPTTEVINNGAIMEAEAVEGVPSGRTYITPDEIFDPGMIFLGENRTPIYRDTYTRETFEIVLTV